MLSRQFDSDRDTNMDSRQKQVHKQESSGSETEQIVKSQQEEANVTAMEGILDEIDAVLEENAESFVQNFVQKGGQ